MSRRDPDQQAAQRLNGKIRTDGIGNWRRGNEPPSGHMSAEINDLPVGPRKTIGPRSPGQMINRLTKKPGGNKSSSVLG